MHEGLRHVGDGAGGPGFHIAAEDCGDDARESSGEVVGRDVVAGEKVGEVLAEFF